MGSSQTDAFGDAPVDELDLIKHRAMDYDLRLPSSRRRRRRIGVVSIPVIPSRCSTGRRSRRWAACPLGRVPARRASGAPRVATCGQSLFRTGAVPLVPFGWCYFTTVIEVAAVAMVAPARVAVTVIGTSVPTVSVLAGFTTALKVPLAGS